MSELRDHYTIKPLLGCRHPISGFSHLLGAILAIAGLVWLLIDSVGSRSAWHVVSFAIFGGSMILLYAGSALYHLLHASDRTLRALRKLDHSMIYVFIAGTYTPVCLVLLRSSAWGWAFFCLVWAIAGSGIVIKLLKSETSRWLRITPYLLMGGLAFVILPRLLEVLPGSGLVWFFGGGAAYVIGSIVYALRRPDPIPSYFGFHELWHLFVMAGTGCHFWMMKQYILPL